MSTENGSSMSGDLSEVHVVELFQMINSSQKTGKVELKLSDGAAKVLFNEGEVVYAEYGKQQGKEAIYALLGVTSGQFVYSPGLSAEAEGNDVIGGFMGLVMEGMQRLDEESDSSLPKGMKAPSMDGDQYF